MRLLLALIAIAAMSSTIAKPALADPAEPSSRAVDATALVPPGASATAYATPPDRALVLSRFCADTCVRCSGATVGGGPFAVAAGRCVNHSPAVPLPPGEQVRCESRCPATSAVLLDGQLRAVPQRVARIAPPSGDPGRSTARP